MSKAKYYLDVVAEDEALRKHADGSECKAQSPDACPFNKKAEAGERLEGREKPFKIDMDKLHKALENRGALWGTGMWDMDLFNAATSPLGVQKWDDETKSYKSAKEMLMKKLGNDEDSDYIRKCLEHESKKERESFLSYLDRNGTASE